MSVVARFYILYSAYLYGKHYAYYRKAGGDTNETPTFPTFYTRDPYR